MSKYLTDDNFMMAEFLITIQVSIILFGIAAIFQYGKQLKEETELTV